MSRTFSLSRLMLGVTVFCVLCGLAVNFPLAVILCAFVAALSLPPAVVVWFALARYSKQRGSLLWNVVIGAFAGCMGGVIASGGDFVGPSWLGFLSVMIYSSIGALVWGCLGLLDEVLPTRKNS